MRTLLDVSRAPEAPLTHARRPARNRGRHRPRWDALSPKTAFSSPPERLTIVAQLVGGMMFGKSR